MQAKACAHQRTKWCFLKCRLKNTVYKICTKKNVYYKNNKQTWESYEKVFHVKKVEKYQKIELYTKLSTLSTFFSGKNVVYIVK